MLLFVVFLLELLPKLLAFVTLLWLSMCMTRLLVEVLAPMPAGAATPRVAVGKSAVGTSTVAAGAAASPMPSGAATTAGGEVFGPASGLAGAGAPCRRTSTATLSARRSHATASPSAVATNS